MKKIKELLNKKWVRNVVAIALAILVAYAIIAFKFDGTYGYYTIKTTEIENCDPTSVTKYYSTRGVTVYLSCLSSVKIKDSIREIELKDFLSGTRFKFDRRMKKVLSVLHEAGLYSDGGSRDYDDRGGDKRTNNGIKITKCNTLDGDRDIYIGPDGADLVSHCE